MLITDAAFLNGLFFANISGMKINYLGDSITFGHGASEYRFRYVGRFVEKYPQATIRSNCIGGFCIFNKCI